MEQRRTLRQPDAIVIAFFLVLTVFSLSTLFRRELYAYDATLYWVFDVFKFVVFPGSAAVFLARRYGIRPKHYGLRGIAQHETWVQFIGLVLFLALLLDLVYYVSLHIAVLIFRPETVTLFYQNINPKGLLRIPVTLYMAVTAGIVEEVLFRGLPLLYLERRFPGAPPRTAYVLTTAALFGLIHWGNGPHEVVATFIFGLLAAILYLRLRDLWPLVVAHFVIDVGWFA